MDKLIQKQGFYHKSFELKKDEVIVYSKDFENESEYSFDYTNLGVRTYRHAEKKARVWQWMLWLTVTFGLLALTIEGIWEYTIIERGWLGALLILCSLAILWFKLKEKPAMIHLIGGENQLELLATEPTKEDVEAFLKRIKKRIKQAYKLQYLNEQEDVLPDEKRSRIEWMYELKIIDRQERKSLLDQLEKEKNNIIGFRM